MRLFMGDRMGAIMDRIGVKEGEVITHRLVTNAIERAQKKVEAYNFDIRKNLIKYDDVMNMQREVVYDRRGFYLSAADLTEEVTEKIEAVVAAVVDKHIEDDSIPETWESGALFAELEGIFLGDFSIPERELELESMDKHQLRNVLTDRAKERYQERRISLPEEIMQKVQRFALLRSLDEGWKEHLLELDNLKSGIGLRGYGQKDPLIEFKREAFGLFEDFISRVDQESLRALFHIQVTVTPVAYQGEDLSRTRTRHEEGDLYRRAAPAAAQAGTGAGTALAPPPAAAIATQPPPPGMDRQPVVKKEPKVGRNDPCPCGSGLKYKKCCGRLTAG